MIGGWINKIANFMLGPLFGGTVEILSPWWLLLIPIAVGLFVWRRNRRGSSMRYSNVELVRGGRQSFRAAVFVALAWLELFGIIFLSIAASRPRSGSLQERTFAEGVDIVLLLDISGSMQALDFKPKNRLEAAKLVAADFIKGRAADVSSNDRIGLVVFAGKAFTQCPLTLDYGVLLEFLEGVQIGQVEDGTAIGTAIATGLNRLRNSEAKSKVMILLTDGVNNRGEVDPITAARAAKALGVKIYTIGAGVEGMALFPVDDPLFGRRHVRMPVEIDEKSLRAVAEITNAEYFRATDTEALRKIFGQIDKLEKTKIEVQQFTRHRELFPAFIWLGLIFLLADIILKNTLFRKIP
jgi:Ca-activated chloride channel family protein